MRICVMSDLHNEFENPQGPRRPTSAWMALRKVRKAVPGHPDVGPLLTGLVGEVDLVILAGDIDLGCRGVEYADQAAKFLGAPAVYVMGNHEAYTGQSMDELIADIRDRAKEKDGRVIFLENESVALCIGGFKLHVLGCSLWTDYRLNGNAVMSMLDAGMALNDHVAIRVKGKPFTADAAARIHAASRQWLDSEVARIREAEPEAAIAIVTHHGPVPDANSPLHRGGKLDPAFASDLSAEIDAWRPALWVWGHTHHSMARRQGDTLLVSAQRGYVGKEPGADSFAPQLVEVARDGRPRAVLLGGMETANETA